MDRGELTHPEIRPWDSAVEVALHRSDVKTIRVHVSSAAGGFERIHDLQNVGEEIHCHFLGTGIVEVADMDSATVSLHIRVFAPRHLGDVTRVIKKALKRYRLSELAQVCRVDR